MIHVIRSKAIDQILSRTGPRPKHFDSTTGDSLSNYLERQIQQDALSQVATDGL